MTNNSYSVQSVHKTLLDTFHQYLSAQYHIWDEWLISERKRILEEVGNTYQLPRLEATPQYAQGKDYSQLAIPSEARAILQCAATDPSTGIPERAYTHQTKAVEQFFTGKDLIVATGTGSGKTESFLMPILSNLAIEASIRKESWSMPGVRALLLYPMNALVNDQLGRLRRLFGNEAVKDQLRGKSYRNARFGMYTSRSPYPGKASNGKNKKRIEKELDQLYFQGMTDEFRARLQAEGKWPAKDLERFIANGFKTEVSDVELITRHEMHISPPDLLVTNYSMLEYMMLRPIEAPIFEQTARWLAQDTANVFTIVLDEAHMYRGSGGAEVAYLLRRLQARLGISRDRIRFILTSASLGASDRAKEDIKVFAAKLTGGESSQFELITGDPEPRPSGERADMKTEDILAKFEYSVLLGLQNFDEVKAALTTLSQALNLQVADLQTKSADLQQFAYDMLGHIPVAYLVAQQLTTSPTTLKDCAKSAFSETEHGELALESLLALMAFAKDQKKGRPFCPIRSHVFFRGLSGLYACTNTECGRERLSAPKILGRLHATERLHCDCGSRVYELLTHRSCGAAYLRAFMQPGGNFLWHQPSNGAWTDTQLMEAQFYVLTQSEVESTTGCVTWLHIKTGQLAPQKPSGAPSEQYLPLLRPETPTRDYGRNVLSIRGDCPACGQRSRPEAPIAMDLATKGEAPFAHLIRAQIATQPISKIPTPQAPNGGRKTIVFSDGRQKAARLARDIPREIELDVFRQTLFMAARELQDLGNDKEPRLNDELYTAFLKCLIDHNLRFFDGDDRYYVEAHLRDFESFYDNSLSLALNDQLKAPPSFWAILLKQLGTPFYSISALSLGYVAPSKTASNRLRADIKGLATDDLNAVAVVWIQRLLARFAFGRDLAEGVRAQASRYPLRPATALDGFSAIQRAFLTSKGVNVEVLAERLAHNLCEAKPDGSIYLRPSHVVLRSALSDLWAQCEHCKTISPLPILGHCPNCTRPGVDLVDPDATSYLRARKGFWRDPVVRVVLGGQSPMSVDVQEHSAQLSHKDSNTPSPTTEVFERQFRDILRVGERSVDVLSCTTTMEVGIDIGSLIAVSMRNVPPMRQNYQQRAGRAGRRGAAVSTVLTYAQTGAHDAFYFLNPDRMLAGDPPRPVLDTNNSRIADRHVLAQLLQDFFRPLAGISKTHDILTVLGDTWSFFQREEEPTSFESFKSWVRESRSGKESLQRAQNWLPLGLNADIVAESMIAALETRAPSTQEGLEASLIEFLFSHGLLPSYAFPTDLCSLQIQELTPGVRGGFRIAEQAQQSLSVALSEYAPGRLVVVNKKTYRVGTVTASGPDSEVNRASALFDRARVYRHCTQCSFTAGFIAGDDGAVMCPQCGAEALRTMTLIRPETVFPRGKREINEFDDEQVYSRVSKAQLPLPNEDLLLQTTPFGKKAGLVSRRQQRLIVVNEGDPNSLIEEVGFRVCELCGKVLSEGEQETTHTRDYYIQGNRSQSAQRCEGEFQRVFLGYDFTSDILLMRVNLTEPLRFDLLSRRHRMPVEDALQTLCEALTLSIGRILDIDSREVSSGFRFGNDGNSDFADIFIYDTLSGGAGYALQAKESFGEIFEQTQHLLADCSCAASCENCLRHYRNRFSHSRLDRSLALEFAAYIEFGEVPESLPLHKQMEVLAPLVEMIKLAGWDFSCVASGLYVSTKEKQFLIEACPSLRAAADVKKAGLVNLIFTPYELARDLPSAFAELT
ncbi:DEAD/DEAH box helicase [Pseudomonas coronafaciens]|uniref:DEAD/DEAH box helicase n=1 Tax=Pseudomonas coronafaciens pv. coronafaciens TaxID=235275 RepID=A0AAE6ULS4_9PSED|nr:DEAD/DEAH box helicase [Pseudomonas coronafaciens]QGT82214.1 DEAD/DEAH box helicase [Pseudomonas coronafaciens pv. coronafaciens]RMM82537.1 Dead/deah box helicase domain protein [Pseudomonas coronafaciens pv. striafaciens]